MRFIPAMQTHIIKESLLSEYLGLQLLKPVVLLLGGGSHEVVQLFWRSKYESSLWQPDLPCERASICDPSMGQKNSLLQLKGLAITTGRLKTIMASVKVYTENIFYIICIV